MYQDDKEEGYDTSAREDFGRKMQNTVVRTLQIVNAQGIAEGADVEKVMAQNLDNVEQATLEAGVISSAKAMWAMDAVKAAFEEQKAGFDDSTRYLFTKIDEIMEGLKYTASQDDILKFRSPTTDFSEIDYSVGKATLRFVDVGGQRKERLKWGTVGKVTAIIFVVALDEYDKTLVEDVTRNRMKESLPFPDDHHQILSRHSCYFFHEQTRFV